MLIVNVLPHQQIAIGDRRLTVEQVHRPGIVRVSLDGDAEPLIISWDRKLEILPGVDVTVKRTAGLGDRVTFMFDAPRSVPIRERPHEPTC